MAAPTSSGQHVLMEDQRKIKKAVRKTTIVMNSRDRNLLNYPNSNRFRTVFRRPLTNIYSIELMNGSVPASIYNVNLGWNQFTFQESDRQYTVTLTPGFYTPTQLCAELEKQLNNIPTKQNTYEVSLDPLSSRVTVSATAPAYHSFALLFYSSQFIDELDPITTCVLSINNPARLLGFGINDYTSDISDNILAPIPMDLENFGNRIYLHLNGDNTQSLHRMEMGAGRQDCFHIFFYKPGESNYLFLDKETYMPIYESSPAPIARMSGLEVSFRDEFNRLVDFKNREVNLIFEITHLE